MLLRARKFGLWLLLVFAIGGVAAPLAHNISHALASQPAPLSPSENTDHEFVSADVEAVPTCELCEVLLSATTVVAEKDSTLPPVDEHAASGYTLPPQSDTYAPQGRGPPLQVS